MNEERFPGPGESLHQGISLGGEGHSSLGGECSSWFAEGKMESTLHGRSASLPCAPQPNGSSVDTGEGWGLKPRLQRSDPGRRSG